MMEVCRSTDPPPGHLETVRELCNANGALLIFDEVSSAWRETLGGRHLMYGVAPDICTFSKTISNGFAMAAVIGTREAMADAAASFISTTYHTERVGPAAVSMRHPSLLALTGRVALPSKRRDSLDIAGAGNDCEDEAMQRAGAQLRDGAADPPGLAGSG